MNWLITTDARLMQPFDGNASAIADMLKSTPFSPYVWNDAQRHDRTLEKQIGALKAEVASRRN